MHGNYRHHYLVSPATQPTATAAATPSPQPASAPTLAQFSLAANSVATPPHQSKSVSRQLQHQHQHQHAMQANGNHNSYNGLPSMAVTSAANGNGTANGRLAQSKQNLPGNYPLLSKQQQQQLAEQNSAANVDRLISSQQQQQRFSSSRHFIDQQHQAHRQTLVNRDPTGRLEYGADMPVDLANQRAAQQQHMQQMHHFQQMQMRPSNHISNNNNNINNNNNNQLPASKQCEFLQYRDEDSEPEEEALSNGHRNQPFKQQQQQQQQHHHHNHHHQQRHISQQLQDNYASQIRNSQLQHRFQHQTANNTAGQQGSSCLGSAGQQMQQQQQQQQVRGLSAAGPSHLLAPPPPPTSGQQTASGAPSPSNGGQARKERAVVGNRDGMHVNFNRSNQAMGADEEEGDSRKKKYLTAKYGQQQMNLIKKRLKIEMWLYEQLQELAKGSGSEAELDEIDVDLDQLLDMEDDDTRRRWLKKMLEPFESLPSERIDKFIDEVLEQSKLL